MGESTLTITRGILAKIIFYRGAGMRMSALNNGAISDE